MMSQELKDVLWYVGVTALGLLVAAVVIMALIKIYNRATCGVCHSYRSLRGKTVLITGANTGIGRETALDLAMRNARVIMACRDLAAGQGTASDIMRRTGNRNIAVKHLDVSSLFSVRTFAKEILKTEQRLDILIHNAGVGGLPTRVLTADDLELTFATNYLGPFLLTHLLLDLLKKSSPARIISVSSTVHRFGDIDFTNLNGDKRYSRYSAYCNSKLAQVMFTKELAERLKQTGVTANCLHPGLVATNLYKHLNFVFRWTIGLGMWLFFKNPTQGAQTTIFLAVSESVDSVSGSYFADCKMAKESPKSFDQATKRQLWDVSLQMCQEVA